MSNNFIQPEELNLTTVFKDYEYVIPIYQRSYAWEKDEIEQLINDIHDSTGRYYLGSLIVDKIDAQTYSVIDGQQRLTTVFLLLSYLKPELLYSSILKFEAREKSNRTLYELKTKQTLVKDNSLYSDEILTGYEIIEKFFQSKSEDYKNEICNRFSEIIIIKTQVPKKIDLNHYFEIMNTRGEQLEIHEIAKGRILGIIEGEKEKNIAAIIWDACSQIDSYIQMNFDTSNRDKIFGESWNQFKPINFKQLAEFMNINSLKEEKRFSLKEKLDNPIIETKKANNENEENERFESIITFPNFLLIANEALQKEETEDDSSLDDKRFIKSLEKYWGDNNVATEFIFNMLRMRYLFDQYIIKREFAKDYKEDGRWSLQRLEAYTDGKEQRKPQYYLTYGEEDSEVTQTLRLLQSALRVTYTSPKTMHWISKTLSELNRNENADVKKLLEEYAISKVVSADYKNKNGFAIDRIVFTYLDYILARDKKSTIQNFQFQFRNSIEHFYPQQPIDSEIWENSLLHNFGNLALITVKANSRFSNLSPKSKVDTYPETINQSPKLQLMKELMQKNGEWNKELVKIHEAEMFSILDNEKEKYGL